MNAATAHSIHSFLLMPLAMSMLIIGGGVGVGFAAGVAVGCGQPGSPGGQGGSGLEKYQTAIPTSTRTAADNKIAFFMA